MLATAPQMMRAAKRRYYICYPMDFKQLAEEESGAPREPPRSLQSTPLAKIAAEAKARGSLRRHPWSAFSSFVKARCALSAKLPPL
ncbi:MAG: hypothetical protein JWQ97_2159 [Phenylobacterium sp.]|nr:hypothetical protein [Phenylobacterium sp.]